MHLILSVAFVIIGSACLSQEPPGQHPPKKIAERKNIGEGKPLLFSRSHAKAMVPASKPQLLIEPVFNTASIGDTLRFPYAGGELVTVLITRSQKSADITVMNLKVINYNNAFMRLTRSRLANAVQYRGLVQHTQYSDALVLRANEGKFTFQLVKQSDLINE